MSTTSAVSSSAGTSQLNGALSSTTLGKEDFLKMLVAQLRNQDPLDPQKGTEFAAQLAQFSTVEQLSNMNTMLTENIQSNSLVGQSINNALASNFIGKNVRAATDSFAYKAEKEVKLGYKLASAADTASVTIYNSNGVAVRTMDIDTDKGEHTLSWDGKDNNGNEVPAGTFTFKVTAKDTSGGSINLTQYVTGTVAGIRFKSDGTAFVIDGVEVPLSSILEIIGG